MRLGFFFASRFMYIRLYGIEESFSPKLCWHLERRLWVFVNFVHALNMNGKMRMCYEGWKKDEISFSSFWYNV